MHQRIGWSTSFISAIVLANTTQFITESNRIEVKKAAELAKSGAEQARHSSDQAQNSIVIASVATFFVPSATIAVYPLHLQSQAGANQKLGNIRHACF